MRKQVTVPELAHRLHDTMAQSLTVALLQIERASKTIDAEPAKAKEYLGEVKNTLRECQHELRLIILALGRLRDIPGELGSEKINFTLEELAKSMPESQGVNIEVTGIQSVQLSPMLSIALGSAAGELLTNVIRHASAKHAVVRLGESEKDIILSVEDDGKGFNVREAERRGLGLATVRAIVGQVGGHVSINSNIDQGTRVVVEIPK